MNLLDVSSDFQFLDCDSDFCPIEIKAYRINRSQNLFNLFQIICKLKYKDNIFPPNFFINLYFENKLLDLDE